MSRINIRNLSVHWALGLIVIGITIQSGFSQDTFSCTEVIGFSQSWQWFTGNSMSESRGNASMSENTFLSNWQGRYEFGASVELWSNQDFKGWEGTYLSLKMCPKEKVDRAIFNISGTSRETQQWVQDITKVVEVLNQKYPNVQQIVLQPVVGANEGKCTEVRAARIYPVIVKAIETVAAESQNQKAIAGATPTVDDCNHYSDRMGHLSSEGALYAHKLLLDYYSGINEINLDQHNSEDR